MRENDAAFGHADAFDGLKGGEGESEGVVAGETDVFAGENDHAAGDEFGIFAGLDHAGEVVEGGVDVGATHRFNEGGDDVVVHVTFFVVAGDDFLGGGFDGFDGDFFGERETEFEVAEGSAGIATAKLSDII